MKCLFLQLYLFTKKTGVTRGEVADVVGLPSGDLKEILRGVSRYRGTRTIWEFLLPTDTAFLNKYVILAVCMLLNLGLVSILADSTFVMSQKIYLLYVLHSCYLIYI